MSVADLPALNATLNAISALLLVIGFVLIRNGHVEAHRRTMISAFACSAAFLTSYVVYHYHAGSKPFTGTGMARTIYFSILVPHVVLAAAVPPLAIVTLKRGLVRNDAAHRKIAKITLPVWLFVSITGVIVYVMLYHW
jgi:uncharacterized membrane protein YozB (DUF420 family)